MTPSLDACALFVVDIIIAQHSATGIFFPQADSPKKQDPLVRKTL